MFRVNYKPSLQRKMDREDGYEDGFAEGETVGFSKGETVGFMESQRQSCVHRFQVIFILS